MTKSKSTCSAALLLFLLMPLTATAATIYIDNKIMIGLHQDKDIDSTIIKLLPGGTSLELLTRDVAFTQVKEPGGTTGWIDNHYLVNVDPGRTQIMPLKEKIASLETELSALKASQNTAPPAADTNNQKMATLGKENEALKQQLQSAQLKVGELQAQAAELRNQLSKENAVANRFGAQDASGPGPGNPETTPANRLGPVIGNPGWGAVLISGVLCIIIGLIGGALLVDLYNRRRHGGFRI